MSVVEAFLIFLYHLQTMKQQLWTLLDMYLDCCIEQQRQKARMRCKMNKFTVLEHPSLGRAQKAEEIGTLDMDFLRFGINLNLG